VSHQAEETLVDATEGRVQVHLLHQRRVGPADVVPLLESPILVVENDRDAVAGLLQLEVPPGQ
jgi:hypothetical protein